MARSGAVKPTGSSGHSYRDDSVSRKSSVLAEKHRYEPKIITCGTGIMLNVTAEPTTATIRRYRETDLAAVYDICVRTADAGQDARGKYRSDDLMGDLFAGPYVFLEPEVAFVLDAGNHDAGNHDAGDHGDGHRAVGYIVGTSDTAAFARAYRARWIPRLADRYQVPPQPPVSPDEQMLALHYWPERLLWPGLAEYPAHLHIDLLPAFQGAGYGRALMARFCDAVSKAGAAGVHVTVVADNVPAIGFYRRLGFEPLPVDDPGPVVYLGRRL
jgi:ribosomal protein S18 acetylase RimI-like enzyme